MRKHYVLGLVFNCQEDKVLLIEKKRPDWMKGRWNGIGGKIEEEETPKEAMTRECMEEIGFARCDFEHKIIFTCPGGTVYVFAAVSTADSIPYKQIEDERLEEWDVNELPHKVMANLEWIIPLCLAHLTFPIMINQKNLGIER